MSVQENKDLFSRFHSEVIQGRKVDSFGDFIADGFVDHSVPPGTEDVAAAAAAGMQMLYAAFPDVEFELEEMIGEEDRVMARMRVRGTHQGDFMGAPPTGKQFDVSSMQLVKFADGKFRERWVWLDAASVMQQLGLQQ